ncbi:hypothetical protein [Burkholderia glumae]|uniref:hypothetical protein n=1 Tax=Burkholderia glumae TaxID=337 RepID=UPI0012963D6E|nr:hypothetical protein [Burkholderia glumae]MCM2552707.1 hypothetical protein [Burkholderia glumae]MCQ0034143.1 hypothetical protein [Burkholderia glumae]MCQ0037412.1 hypothetical protein [Burkholderia glumae]QGA41766.1 hypothetical protein GAS19_30240 [Burkholderia glumae]
MASKRRWTYAELTGAAEEEIVFWMNQAATAAREGRPAHDDFGQGAARGVFGLWRYLTGGERSPGDADRLEALTRRASEADMAE